MLDDEDEDLLERESGGDGVRERCWPLAWSLRDGMVGLETELGF